MFEKTRYILKNRKGSIIATIGGGLAIALGLAGALKPIDEEYEDETEFEEENEESEDHEESPTEETEG